VTGSVADSAPRTPLDVTLRAFAIARNRRYELERQMAPSYVEIIELPRPEDGRSIFDFGGADTLIDEGYAMASRHLDELDQNLETVEDKAARRWFKVLRRSTAEVA